MSVRAERLHQAASQRSAALSAELDEERRKYQGLLREFTRLEQRYDNLREMSQLAEVGHRIHDDALTLWQKDTSFWPSSLCGFLRITVHQRPQADRLHAESLLGAAVTPVSHPALHFTLPVCLPFTRGGPQDERHFPDLREESLSVEV